jgi:hypothetical protein
MIENFIFIQNYIFDVLIKGKISKPKLNGGKSLTINYGNDSKKIT